MSQPSSMFAARDISQTILGTFFLGHPVDKLDKINKLNKLDKLDKLDKIDKICR